MHTTVGQILINEELPEDLRDYTRVLDKKSLSALFREIQKRYPDKYRSIAQKFHEIGKDIAYQDGSSFSIKDIVTTKANKLRLEKLRNRVREITDTPSLGDEQKEQLIVDELLKEIDTLPEDTYRESLSENNPFSIQILSGSRGNPSQLNSMRGADLLVKDHKDRPIGIPILHNYGEGLDPVEYWAGSYGARKGMSQVKFATADVGFFGKQLSLAAHEQLATDEDLIPGIGLPVDTEDRDNIGAALGMDYGPYKAGTIITPKIQKDLMSKYKKLLVYSPVAAISKSGGIPRLAVGIREKGDLPPLNDNVGMAAAQSVSERISQTSLGSKHTGGVVGQGISVSGFDLINQLVQIPKTFKGGATHSKIDGRVTAIVKAPQGGHYITIGNENHYAPDWVDIKVKPGDDIEAGDILTTGIPNPADLVKYKGIGEGRRLFLQIFSQALKENDFPANRRNLELLSRSLINHIRITDNAGHGDLLPDDLTQYESFAADYTPRAGSMKLKPKMAKDKYLETPVLHYSIGTKITPRVIKELSEFDVPDVEVHDDPPVFEPVMIRGMESLAGNQDWMTQLGGFYLGKNLLRNAQRSSESNVHGMSYIPGLSYGVEFGKNPKKLGY